MMGGTLAHQDTYLFPGDFVPIDPNAVPNMRMVWEVIPPLLDRVLTVAGKAGLRLLSPWQLAKHALLYPNLHQQLGIDVGSKK